MTSATTVETLPQSLQKLITDIQGLSKFSPAILRNLVREAGIKTEELTPWADFNHAKRNSYGRKMVFDGGFFEIMVMSWQPGDYSAIHDHGYTQWGAVQVFGEAEHAVFWAQDDQLRTITRFITKNEQVLAVGHDLIHQMGCPREGEFFLSLHIYGNYERQEDITADARILEFEPNVTLRTTGGAFFALPQSAVNQEVKGFQPDFATRLRYLTETLRRMEASGQEGHERLDYEALRKAFYDGKQHALFLEDLEELIDENGHATSSAGWKLLQRELTEAAALQAEHARLENQNADLFFTYAEVYDGVIGKPCLENFIKGYLHFFQKRYGVKFEESTLLSIGCGTGLMENYMIDALGLRPEGLLGIDISEAMVKIASRRINADVGDALTLDPEVQMWDITFCGLNVFQYLKHHELEEAIRRVAAITNKGGYFIGDFITPDHIRWYPNVIISEDKNLISLRTPKPIEAGHMMYIQSEILNVSFKHDTLRITHEGVHHRYLPPMSRVMLYFQKYFEKVHLYDAVSLEPLSEFADTSPSTRYLVVAQA